MNRDHLPPTPDDALLQRYREANELDTARPGAALRENVLAHARAAAASRTDAIRPEVRPAANDSAWAWRALGSVAVIGLVGLLVLQFDRGTPEEKELALGTGTTRPAAETAASSLPPVQAVAPAAPAESAAAQPQPPQPVTQQQEPEAAASAPPPASPRRSEALTPETADRMARAETPQEPDAVAPAASAEMAPEPQAPAAAIAPAPAAKAMAPHAPAPMPRAAPAAGAPAPATADRAAPAGSSRNAAEGMLRERREIAGVRPPPLPSPLFVAIASGDAEAVVQRLAEGADPNGRDPNGRTPLMAAAQTGNEAVVRVLLAAGADRTLRDRDGLGAADHAERRGHPGLLPLLR